MSVDIEASTLPPEELLETIGPNDVFAKRKRRYIIIRTCSIVFAFAIWEIFGRQVNPLFMSYPSKIVLGAISLDSSRAITSRAARELAHAGAGLRRRGCVRGSGRACRRTLSRGRGRAGLADQRLLRHAARRADTLVILWFGLGFTAKLFIVFLFALFPILINTSIGVRNVNRSLIDVGVAFVANERQIFTRIILPASLPYIMAGLRLGIGRAIIGMVTAEFFTAISGLGGLVVKYGNQFRTDEMLVPVIILMVLGVILTGSLQRAEQLIAPWKSNENNE